MRPIDLLHLSLAALWQQKLRTVLTTLGVAFGALVLFISISLGIGVQDTIIREARKYDEMRRVGINPKWELGGVAPSDVSNIQGEMSADRRQRLKTAAEMRWSAGRAGRQVPITPKQLAALAEIEHVEQVEPNIYLNGWVHFRGKAEHASFVAVHPSERAYEPKLLSGAMFPHADGKAVLVSEYLLHRLGLTDDADLQRIVGAKIRVEMRARRMAPAGLRFHIYREGGGPSTRSETLLREKLQQALPLALDKLDLTEDERKLLEAMMKPPSEATAAPQEIVINEEFEVVGVFRMPIPEDQKRAWEGLNYFADLVLPSETAKRLFLQLPSTEKEPGFGGVSLRVDREENVKGVQQQVVAMGYSAYSHVDYIERDQFLYKLIFSAMTCIAAVALLVAALGITNTMLMSVLERTREVGIMKAVGAAEGHVQLIFLIEGALIGLVGGGLGVLLSWVCSIPGDRWIRSLVEDGMKVKLDESLFIYPLWLISAVILFCGLVTVLAAVYPARRAARVNAVTALRHE